MTFIGREYNIQVELQDEEGLTTVKNLKLSLSINQEWYQRDFLKNVTDEGKSVHAKSIAAFGKADSISVFGEVDITLNLS